MTLRTKTTLVLALSLLLPTACDLEEPSELPRASLADQTQTQTPRPDDPPPPVLLLRLAVERGGLDDDPTMAPVLAEMERSHADAMAAQDALREAVVEAVTTGPVTAERLSPALSRITATARDEARALTVALDTAHDRLDADLRAQVVDALPEPPAPPSLEDRPPPPEGGDLPPPDGDRPPPEAGPEGAGPMGDLLVALELDEQQRDSLREALGEPPQPEPPPPLDLASFADDGFDASTLGLVDLHDRHQTERATHLVELMVALVPLLDEEQRAVLVELLDAPPPAPTRTARG